MRKVTIKAESLRAAGERFKRTWKTGQAEGEFITFEDGDLMLQTLTRKRWELINTLMNRGAMVIDLRPQEQFSGGHLSGARAMNGEQILKASELLKKHKGKALLVYDETGSLGMSAARQLKAQGFEHAVSLRGGAVAWRAENLPLTKD